MQAYPDEIGKMDFAHRRDAFCGKFSVTDVFTQYQVPFTVLKPHVVHPLSEKFQENLRDFAAICRVVNGMKRFTIGCIGARTTAFKTTRFDEIGLQKNGITVEAFDLSEVFYKVNAKEDNDPAVLAKKERLENYTDFSNVPEDKKIMLSKISVVIDEYVEEYVNLPTNLFGKGDFYILRAKGNSMEDAGISEGDLVVILKQSTAEIGDIVVALDDQNQNTLKRFAGFDEDNKVVLEYMNEDVYPGKTILVKELTVQGVAKHVIKSM